MYINTNVSDIQKYNPTTLVNQDSLQAFVTINLPFRCDCIDGEVLGHVFNYNLGTGDTYETIAQERYANLTTEDWIQRFNSYDYDRLPDTGNVNVTVNSSCGDSKISKDYGLFLTYTLRSGETLESISSATNLSSDLIRSYNPGVNFS
ncbi:putative non-specific serine/threonine protein kinase [Helianthus debilis subsp. tardiflorus]